VTYAYLTHGRTKQQIREIDLILAGPDGETPQEVAKRNQEAMAALGQVGQVRPKRKAKAM
jgi:hypothetical protein